MDNATKIFAYSKEWLESNPTSSYYLEARCCESQFTKYAGQYKNNGRLKTPDDHAAEKVMYLKRSSHKICEIEVKPY